MTPNYPTTYTYIHECYNNSTISIKFDIDKDIETGTSHVDVESITITPPKGDAIDIQELIDILPESIQDQIYSHFQSICHKETNL